MACPNEGAPSPGEIADYTDWPWQSVVAFYYPKWEYSIKSTLRSM